MLFGLGCAPHWLRDNRRLPRILPAAAALLVLGLLFAPVAPAAAAGAVAQSYTTTSTGIAPGTLVSLASGDANEVVPATESNARSLAGAAAAAPVLELSRSGSASVQVVVGGTTEALVSDVNGPVQSGDRISVSPLAGIGMKATSAGEVVGTAEKSLGSVHTVKQRVTGSDGKPVTVTVGLVPVAVNVAYYSALSSSGSVSAFVPPFLQSLANAVAGKAVSPLRVLLAAAGLLLGFAAVIVMLAVGVRSGVISLGRNPLAADALRRGMVDVLVTAVGVLLATGVIVGGVLLG